MRRMLVTVVALVTLAAAPAAAAAPRELGAGPRGPVLPTTIPLPDGFFPEGIAIDGLTAYVGSLVDGSIVQQDLLNGDVSAFADAGGEGRIAVGMDVDRRGRLWVAGGGPALSPGVASSFRVYDTRTGDLLVDEELPFAGFVNDVIVTRDAAWFTDSFAPQLIRVPLSPGGAIGEPEPVPLVGEWDQVEQTFNANGIVAARGGRTLIVGQTTNPDGSGTARLYRVPTTQTGDGLQARVIDLNEPLVGTDGLVLVGRTLYSVAGGAGVVKLRLSGNLHSGRILETLEVPDSVSPTTADVLGRRLYVVDAKFPSFGDPTVPFQTTAIRR